MFGIIDKFSLKLKISKSDFIEHFIRNVDVNYNGKKNFMNKSSFKFYGKIDNDSFEFSGLLRLKNTIGKIICDFKEDKNYLILNCEIKSYKLVLLLDLFLILFMLYGLIHCILFSNQEHCVFFAGFVLILAFLVLYSHIESIKKFKSEFIKLVSSFSAANISL